MKRLFKAARVVDPVNGRNGVFDVLIDADRIAAVGRDLPIDAQTSVVEIPSGLVLCPGLIDTPMTAMLKDPSLAAVRERFISWHMLKRPGRPEEVAAVALFLLSTTPPSSPASRSPSTAD